MLPRHKYPSRKEANEALLENSKVVPLNDQQRSYRVELGRDVEDID